MNHKIDYSKGLTFFFRNKEMKSCLMCFEGLISTLTVVSTSCHLKSLGKQQFFQSGSKRGLYLPDSDLQARGLRVLYNTTDSSQFLEVPTSTFQHNYGLVVMVPGAVQTDCKDSPCSWHFFILCKAKVDVFWSSFKVMNT